MSKSFTLAQLLALGRKHADLQLTMADARDFETLKVVRDGLVVHVQLNRPKQVRLIARLRSLLEGYGVTSHDGWVGMGHCNQ